MMNYRCQQGATLIVSLLMLIMMTMLALSSMNISNTNLKVIGNMQSSKELEAAAQQGIEQMLLDDDYYSSTGGAGLIGGGTVDVYGQTVTVSPPVCIDSAPAEGSGVSFSLVPEDNTWVYTATVTDTVTNTGATATITQGTRLRMLAGNCP